jgi:ribonuclease III
MSPFRYIKKIFSKSSQLGKLEKITGYHFNNLNLLNQALIHRSIIKDNSTQVLQSNERLEFLGDAVLGLVVSRFLYERFPEKREGDLTKLKAVLVSESTLSRIAKDINLGQFLQLSEEENKAGGRERNSILADAYEALIGATFLDGGLAPARKMIRNQLLKKYWELTTDEEHFNYKGGLLEYLQSFGWGMPRYEIVEEKGPDHQKRFTIDVFAQGKRMGRGTGTSKKEAEQKAAKKALENINKGELLNRQVNGFSPD